MRHFVWFLGFRALAFASFLPVYDTRCDSMLCTQAVIAPQSNKNQEGYFLKEAPKVIHQIWFGDKSRLDEKKRQPGKSTRPNSDINTPFGVKKMTYFSNRLCSLETTL